MSRINFKDLAKNWGLATADATLSTFGATDVIKNNQYVGDNADKWAMAGNISGAISKTALPLAMNATLPGSGQFVSMGQGLVGQTTNQNSNMFPMGGMNMQYAQGGINADFSKLSDNELKERFNYLDKQLYGQKTPNFKLKNEADLIQKELINRMNFTTY